MGEIWNYEFMRYALCSACILGPTCALLGVFVTLRGMAFFSDALAHSAVTGVALGFLVEEATGMAVDPMVTVLLFSLMLAGVMAVLSARSVLSPDTVIAFSFTGSVALGVVVIGMLGKYRLLDGILFGSIYANGPSDIVRQLLLAAAVLALLVTQMRGYAMSALSPELGAVCGLGGRWLDFAFAMLVAVTVVVALKMLGALLLSALIVIPAAAAKLVSGGFRSMLVVSLACGAVAPVSGVMVSYAINVPTGPCMVLANVLFLVFCYGWRVAMTCRES